MILCGLLITYATSFDTDHIHKCRCLILIQIVRHSGGVIEFSDLYFLFIGTVSGSGTGPLDYGATGPVPDTEPRL